MKKPKVDKVKCIGCGTCTALCPKTFVFDPDYKAEVANPTGEPESEIQNAIDSCPTQAIFWEESS